MLHKCQEWPRKCKEPRQFKESRHLKELPQRFKKLAHKCREVPRKLGELPHMFWGEGECARECALLGGCGAGGCVRAGCMRVCVFV